MKKIFSIFKKFFFNFLNLFKKKEKLEEKKKKYELFPELEFFEEEKNKKFW
jgi:hypothetical protein